jgi:hypothetical protein
LTDKERFTSKKPRLSWCESVQIGWSVNFQRRWFFVLISVIHR